MVFYFRNKIVRSCRFEADKMKKNNSTYWWCQIGGWLFYALVLAFFSFVVPLRESKTFPKDYVELFSKRILLTIVFGIFFTHLFRILLHKFNLHPTTQRKRWPMFILLLIVIIIVNSITHSLIVQKLGWYDASILGNKDTGFLIFRRFVYNLLNDFPSFLIWASIYYVYQLIESDRRAVLDKARLETQVKELELKTIKAHINPHFIFNALNSIRALVDENPNRARTAITELSNILRSSMQADKLETTTLEKELNIVKDYLALEHIRFEDRLKVNYDIDEDTLDQLIPPMMVQTLVENAIKHGISKQVNGGIINVIADFVKDDLEIKVQNSGQLNGEMNTEGFGIASTYNRLNLLFDKKAKFELKNLEGMVEAKIIIPV